MTIFVRSKYDVQNMNNSLINIGFAIIFAIFGLIMLGIGGSVLLSSVFFTTAWNIGFLACLSGVLLLVGGFKTYKKDRERQRAEAIENLRIAKEISLETALPLDSEKSSPEKASAKNSAAIFVRWTFSKTEWQGILKKLLKKTIQEEIYAAVWLPILLPIIFRTHIFWSILAGLILAVLYLLYQYQFVKNHFGTALGDAEIIITDSYIRLNGYFISYADGKNYLKELTLETDKNLGETLHFCIGWQTSKGYSAYKDLYIPIPEYGKTQAASLLQLYQQAKAAHI